MKLKSFLSAFIMPFMSFSSQHITEIPSIVY